MDKNILVKEPVSILKGGVVLSIKKLYEVQTPYQLLLADGKTVDINIGDKPMYFGRKRFLVKNGVAGAPYVYRWSVGVYHEDGTFEKHWASPEGNYIESNPEPISEFEKTELKRFK